MNDLNGTLLGGIIADNDLVVLNDGTLTYTSRSHGTQSALDTTGNQQHVHELHMECFGGCWMYSLVGIGR